ncbi:MAG: hypothetical protein M1829_004076 [Trizodia sp. TS-e1964]|nr:MAG: hypothetical protein M1829_004076 [Trizodia sp. TS-e1964]
MPVTGLSFSSLTDSQDHSSATSFGPVNTSDYLLQEDEGERSSVKKDVSTTSPDVHSYLQVHATSDKFPILVTSKDMPGLLSASSAALDLALSQSPGPESQQNGWPSFARHRQGQQSLPMNSLTLSQSGSMGSSINSNNNPSSGASHSYNRKSLDLPGYSIYNDKPPAGKAVSSPIAQATPPKLQASFSTNDIPTVKSSNGLSIGSPTPNNHAHQHFQNHNASLGRIPPNGVNNRLSRDLSATDIAGAISKASTSNGYPSFQSALHPNAAPFGPTISNALVPQTMQITPSVPAVPYGPGNYYGNYQLGINPNMQMNNPQLFIPSPTPYQLYTFPKPESHAKVLQQRRTTDGEAMNRFTNVKLEDLRGEIYQLCKDQHGCRYLQKKLEERSASNIHIIFLETNDHVVELMTDPFGNYLCQKLLEYTGDDERTILINNAAPHLVTIALNQHGTRALQKMIEFISTEEQITTIMYALRDKVVELIQDLNGNHVIQKCLNRLSSADAQFIFDAVASHCVAVGTHRHGCCVLQRCVDHATGVQKANLINAISENSIALVQDPFGNYVVQYILDLHEPMFTEPLLKHFKGQIATLSMQKFSSNVIEKCIRCAKPETRISMIEEIMVPADLEKLLRDPFANYVVQTAMDHGDEATKVKLIDNIRPFLPSIRTLSYGRRIQGKIQDRDDHLATINGTAQTNPNTGTAQGKAPVRANLGSNNHRNNQHHAQNQNQNQIQGQGNMNNNNQQNFMNNGGKFSNNNGYGRSNAGAGGSGANSSLANSGTSTPSQPLIAQHQFSGNGLPQQSGIGHMEINPNMMHQAFFNSFGPGGPINGPGPSNPPPNYF